MALIRSIAGVIVVLFLVGPANAEECAFGERDGESGVTFKDLPYYWIFNVFADSARAFGASKVYGFGNNATANTVFEIPRSDGAARQSKTYRSFIEIKYFPEAPPPRALKAQLEIGGSNQEFAVAEKTKDGSTSTIDLTLLYPALIGAVRKGETAHMTIFDGDKKFIEQYFVGASMTKRFGWMEFAMAEIFATADAGKCPDAPAQAPLSGKGEIVPF